MNRFLTRACAVAAAGVVLSTWVVTAASASGGGGVPIHRSPAGLVAGGGGALRPTSKDHPIGQITTAAKSRYQAGYQATVRAGSATVAAASFTVPTLACTTAYFAIAPMAAVWENNYKSDSIAGVFTGCVNGTAVYYPALVDNGKETDYTTTHFSAGDVIDVTTKVSHLRTRVQVTDVTTAVTEKIVGPGASANAAFIGDDGWGSASGSLLGVPNFGKLTFKNCLVDGKALGGWRPQAIQRVNSRGVVQIATGAMWPGGTAFTTRYRHS